MPTTNKSYSANVFGTQGPKEKHSVTNYQLSRTDLLYDDHSLMYLTLEI